MFERPIAGIFMTQENYGNFRKCLKQIQEYYDILELSGRNRTKRIFLAGESSRFENSIKVSNPEFEVIRVKEFKHSVRNLRYRFSRAPLLETILETHLMLECDFVCSPFESDEEKIVYELMNAQFIDVFKKVKSVDKTYFVHNEIPNSFKEIYGNRNETFFEKFHMIVNGSFSVFSSLERKFQSIPAYKLEKTFLEGDFPTYSSVSR